MSSYPRSGGLARLPPPRRTGGVSFRCREAFLRRWCLPVFYAPWARCLGFWSARCLRSPCGTQWRVVARRFGPLAGSPSSRQHSRRLQRRQVSAPPRRLNTALTTALRPVLAILLARGFARRADASASLVADTVSDLNCAAPVARRRRRATNTSPVLARHHTCRESKETVINESHISRRRTPHSSSYAGGWRVDATRR